MPKTPPLPLLQPLAEETPLAALLNRWLAALAPIAALMSPDHPSFARDCLRDVTAGAHFFHRAVTQTIRRLESGRDLKPIHPYIRTGGARRSLSQPVSAEELTLTLALRSGEVRATTNVSYFVRHAGSFWKLVTQPSPFLADCLLLRALFNGGYRASVELAEPDHPERRATALAILHSLLAADGPALRHLVGTIETRFPIGRLITYLATK